MLRFIKQQFPFSLQCVRLNAEIRFLLLHVVFNVNCFENEISMNKIEEHHTKCMQTHTHIFELNKRE